MWETIAGIVAMLLGIWEFYATYKAFKGLQKHGTNSNFILVALWSGLFLGFIFFMGGITLIFHGY
ncbi:immunity protein [Lactobacillus sp. ESL0791]|uniref:immunity protein n=1 Tax=Lactobacillus sp. ESL0791 TaxID=2983234 RepID=UPI0023F6D8CD|nr:immunity protein [Lactobacillus sp. ESL0791]MDF7638325.1 immunity protein [Lactobacillus sp. ESL0791]